ncbi:MAG: hypothetical protein ABJA20_07205 [Novosphingobium sp.]
MPAFGPRILSRIARQHGGKLIDGAVGKLVPVPVEKPGIAGTLLGAALMRIATRSVPGAIIVGGGMLAKALHEQRKAKRAVKSQPQ